VVITPLLRHASLVVSANAVCGDPQRICELLGDRCQRPAPAFLGNFEIARLDAVNTAGVLTDSVVAPQANVIQYPTHGLRGSERLAEHFGGAACRIGRKLGFVVSRRTG